MNTTIKIFAASMLALSLASCNDFLDVLPDNRAEINNEEKVIVLNTSAYSTTPSVMMAEYLSDNIDNFYISFRRTNRFLDQAWSWNEVTEDNDESPESIWEGYYRAVANANQSLASIRDENIEMTEKLEQAKAEALLCRAYGHFMLANLFCMPYNESSKNSELGIPYITEPETTLKPHYERGTLAEVYDNIQKDLEEALPIIGDINYTVPKYHFNKRAAYAFATRFYTYTGQWEKALQAAETCIGIDPSTILRDWKALGNNLSSGDYDVMKYLYIDATEKANFLLIAAHSQVGVYFGPYSSYSTYSHGKYVANTESYFAGMPWGTISAQDYFYGPKRYQGGMDRVCVWNLPYLFEYTDPVARIGYAHTVYPAFFTEETLLNRVEANIMLENYDDAVRDLNLWAANTFSTARPLTKEGIISFINGTDYYTWEHPTIKKHLNPMFEIGAEGSDKEAMIQFLLYCRRIETVGQGLRWFDIRRFGIEVERRMMNEDGEVKKISDVLTVDDKRRAIQIPRKVVDAGLTANPR